MNTEKKNIVAIYSYIEGTQCDFDIKHNHKFKSFNQFKNIGLCTTGKKTTKLYRLFITKL